MPNKFLLGIFSVFAVFTLAACSWNDKTKGDTTANGTYVTNMSEKVKEEFGDNMDGKSHSDVTNSTWGEIPKGLKEAKNPKFPVGSKVIIQAEHFKGMKGVEATIVGAYETTVYSISYTPTTNLAPKENDKWFVKEEIKGFGDKTLVQGADVIINVDRKEGMKGAAGVIDTAEKTIVYMVDFLLADGRQVKNYKWLKESELSAK